MFKNLFLLLFVSFALLQAKATQPPTHKPITLKYLKQQPKGVSRDFYIWLFLQQEISPKEASEAYKLAKNKNTKLFGLYFKKGDNKNLSLKTICERMPLSKLIKQDTNCISKALTLKKAETLDKRTLTLLSKKLTKVNPTLSKSLAIIAHKNPFNELIKENANFIGNFYFNVSQSFKTTHLNKPIPPKRLAQLLSQKNSTFLRMLKSAMISQNMSILSHSFLDLDYTSSKQFLDYESSFYLGMNFLFVKQDKAKSLALLETSLKKSYRSLDQNRAIFWKFLASKDTKFLNQLVEKKDIDIYSLAAIELTKSQPKFNIIHTIDTKETKANWNIQDPFEWEKILQTYRKTKDKTLLEKVNHTDTTPHFVWLSKKAGEEYFLTPYPEIFSKFSKETQALLYALGRQESLFIPTAISTSYALGIMQLMPFNVEAIAKDFKEDKKVGYLDMFNPNINVRYAEYFTRPLLREFKHPLFISYAYNGGPGFTRRLLAKNYLFKQNNPLDPWYSIEMIPYEESRIYGKKVLANYVIYKRIFGFESNLLPLLKQTLIY
ncbi:lytic murein transglycosylase [Helicobacter valdiviensis]|uniref:Lytic murein transglycosylase n=1 Tax=Helicobacter valdiviensis TaxID=1458358 RepID=A0A2W6MSY7_9HELI|nr:lytic transglycosylase domain-containing protein [Helicobacter valdiviensis]PZT47664.1 lytic murein transglycosylase [Helicobacter valdiviensis]